MIDQNRIPGIPKRMGEKLSAMRAEGALAWLKNPATCWTVWEFQNAVDRVPLDGDEAAIFNAADRASRECYEHLVLYKQGALGVVAVQIICRKYGVPVPAGETNTEIIKRALDRGWWLRQLRKEHARRFEHMAIKTGLVGLKTDPYISRESAWRQAERNAANQALLENTEAVNENGDVFNLADLAAKGVANKAIRRGELMTRIRGFEEIARALGHVGLFWTITAPSKFHSVGGTNPKYNGATPRDAQRYLCGVWARIRAALHRAEIRPYGFRIAEPHSDGCPHWHMLFFVPAEQVEQMDAIVRPHALAEDAEEKGAKENRVKLVRIETDGGRSAVGYIAKYISKNIDGFGVGDHKTFERGTTYTIQRDMFGQWELTPSMRVTYWSQVWGIRQFQQIGGVPVGLWREFRRIKGEAIENAPDAVRRAWEATNKKVAEDSVIQASFADFIQACGGVFVGRNGRIALAKEVVTIEGRYATYQAKKPIGVMCAASGEVYKSVRYTWTIRDKAQPVAVGFASPWTGVNNCTPDDADDAKREEYWKDFKKEWAKNPKFFAPQGVGLREVREAARTIEKESQKFAWKMNHASSVPEWAGDRQEIEWLAAGWDTCRRYDTEGRLI